MRKTNKQVNELLGRYPAGIKLLSELGFEDRDGFYANSTHHKYLKLYRTDLDLAFKHFVLSHHLNK